MERKRIRNELRGLRIDEIRTDSEKPGYYRFILGGGIGEFTVEKTSIFDEDGNHFEDDTDF